MYTACRGGGAFCNGQPINVSQQEGEPACARTSRWRQHHPERTLADSFLPSLLYFSIPDISQSLVLTEVGFKKNPEHFKTMLGNINAILTIPVHGCVSDRALVVTHANTPRRGRASSPGQMKLISVSFWVPPQHPLSGQRRRQHVSGGVRLG